MPQNSFLLFVKYVVVDLAGDFLYFPMWWYTKGFKKCVVFTVEKVKDTENMFAVRLWANSLFKPMYAQRDWQGRIISFFMRFAQLIFRSIFFGLFFVLILFIPIIWLILPIFVVFQIAIIFVNSV
ncbi:hypothetical protein HOD96_02770 [Candidatus Falkowbacteria bacterium]|jgi:hypothetical protein|nr:hypothetical protein [Candidatus Falkowbacteria bacterium]MBT4433500.1 hypothetical protein [Candidatus Falkowbacteria bacterium]